MDMGVDRERFVCGPNPSAHRSVFFKLLFHCPWGRLRRLDSHSCRLAVFCRSFPFAGSRKPQFVIMTLRSETAMTIPLQSSVVYGPIDSRRFGKSLGINLLPSDQKICSFDCLYCQYGETAINKLGSFPDLGHIHEEVQERLIKSKENKEGLSWIMIAGNGEPTLHPQFHEAVKLLLSLREAYAPAVPIGILSNSSTCHRPDIQDSLLKLDGRFMKLDAGD